MTIMTSQADGKPGSDVIGGDVKASDSMGCAQELARRTRLLMAV
jgi:hypothetical protein